MLRDLFGLCFFMDFGGVASLSVIAIYRASAAFGIDACFFRVVLRALRDVSDANGSCGAVAGRTYLVEAFRLAYLRRDANGRASLNGVRSFARFSNYDGLFLRDEYRRAFRDDLRFFGHVVSGEVFTSVRPLLLDRFTKEA